MSILPIMFALLALLALGAELALGYPERIYRAIGHPVTWIGTMIRLADRALNRENRSFMARRLAGVVAIAAIVVLVGVCAWGVQSLLGSGAGLMVTAVLASTLLAQRSLASHVQSVADALGRGGIEGGRQAVAMIVGRDVRALDEAGVSRAAIESLAENFSDGIVAPALWLVVAGLPGAAIYKAVNTADSMIGHKTPRHMQFGWAAARLDDLINLPASRVTALLLIGAALLHADASPANAVRAVWRDAGRHRSPNAGWPEAAMAGALGLSLAGARSYAGVLVEDAEMGSGGRREANAADIRRALKLYRIADALLVACVAVVAAFFIWHG